MAATLIFLAAAGCFCTRHWIVGTLCLLVAAVTIL
jgi:hypothetical protein